MPIKLTPLEEKVLALVAQAMTNAEIAVKLNIKVQVVKNVNHQICEKLGLRNRVAMALYHVQGGK